MSFPKPGQGAIVGSIGQQVDITTIFLAPYVAAAIQAPPGGPLKLNSSTFADPGGTWVRQGLLRDDNKDITDTDPQKLEYRRGFKRVYQGEVIRQAGVRTIAYQMDEIDNNVLALLTGETPTTLGSPGDNWLEMGTSEQYHKSVLAVCFEALSDMETHYYSPHAIVTYKLAKNAEFIELAITCGLIPFINASNLSKDLKRYEFPTGR